MFLQRMMVDEADIDPLGAVRGSGSGGAGGKRGSESPRAVPPKRKAGPLPQHVVARRPSTPPVPPTPPHLPMTSAVASPPPAAPLSPVMARRPASPLAPVPSDLPSGRPPEVSFLYISRIRYNMAFLNFSAHRRITGKIIIST